MDKLVFKKSDEYKEGETIIFSEQIQQRIQELAQEIAPQMIGKKVVLVCVLKGALPFASDLFRALHTQGLTDSELDFLQVSSYGSDTTAVSEPKLLCDVQVDLKDRTVLLVDDIIDSGKSLKFTSSHLTDKGASEVLTCVLLDKPSRRAVEFTPDFVGFTIPDIWVQGYGMDTDEKGRGDTNIIKGPYFY